MKKSIGTLLVMLAMLFVASPSQAQVKFGVVGGLNLSKVSFDKIPSVSSDNRCGWYIGPKLEAKIPLIGLGVDASVQYSQRKLNGEYDPTGDAETSTYKSLEIPINLRYSIGLPSLASLYVATGPQFGFNIGSTNWKWTNTSGYELKKSNVTWNIGAGARLMSHLEIGLGYNFALGKFTKNAIGLPNPDSSFKSNSWQIQLSYFF